MALTFTPLSRAGWSASATSTFSGTYLASNVLDGNTSTSCISSGGGGVGWELTVNFGSAQTFNTLKWQSRTDAGDACIQSFEVYVSNNGSTWGSPVASGYWPNLTVAIYQYLGPQTAQYVKVKSLAIYGTFAASCCEFNVGAADYAIFSPIAMADNTTPSPFVASASSQYPSTQYYAWHAFEMGNTPSFWATASGTSGWLKLDLGSGNTNTLQWYSVQCDGDTSRQPKDWTMEGSNDDSTWTTLDTVTAQTSWTVGLLREYVCDVATTAYRYFRLNVSANNAGDLLRVDVLVLYGPALAVPAGPPRSAFFMQPVMMEG
jgi:hypothetical protein